MFAGSSPSSRQLTKTCVALARTATTPRLRFSICRAGNAAAARSDDCEGATVATAALSSWRDSNGSMTADHDRNGGRGCGKRHDNDNSHEICKKFLDVL